MNERQKKIMVPYEETTDTCPDCSNHPCDCGMPAGYAPTPRTETDLFEATKVSLEYGNQRLFKKSQSTRIVGEVAFSDGYEYALKHSSKIKQLERELAAAQEEIDMMGIRYAAAEMHHANNMQEVTEQRDEYRDIASELIAMIRINVMRDTFKTATTEQVNEHLKPWIERIAAVKGGADE